MYLIKLVKSTVLNVLNYLTVEQYTTNEMKCKEDYYDETDHDPEIGRTQNYQFKKFVTHSTSRMVGSPYL